MVGDDTYFAKNQQTLFNDACIKTYWFRNSVTSMSSFIYQPLLAENLLVQDYAASSIPDVAKVPPLDHPALPPIEIERVHPRYREMFIIDKVTNNLERTSECVARTDPQGVFRLALTVAGSAQEGSQLGALQQVITSCGGAKLGVSFPAFVWRGTLVNNLYRLVDAARPIAHDEVTPHA